MNAIRSLFKRHFDWTPRDVAQWETIRARGLARFVLWHGLQLFALGLFLLLGAAVLLLWAKDTLEAHGAPPALLMLQLLLVAAACITGGVLNSLLTWALEEYIYQQIKKRSRINAEKAA